MQVKKAERRRWCSDHLLNARSLVKAVDIVRQLRQHLSALKMPLKSCGTDDTPLRRALLSGLFLHAAVMLPDGKSPEPTAVPHTTGTMGQYHELVALLTS
jgi:hypothetical protein